MVEVDPYLRNFEEKSLGRGARRGRAGRGGGRGEEERKGATDFFIRAFRAPFKRRSQLVGHRARGALEGVRGRRGGGGGRTIVYGAVVSMSRAVRREDIGEKSPLDTGGISVYV